MPVMLRLSNLAVLLAALVAVFSLAGRPALAQSAAPEATLAQDGQAQLPIVTAPEASEAVRNAATTLADYLGRISGGEFAVETGDGTAGIVVGTADDFDNLPFDVEFGDGPLDREDYVLRSGENGLWLIGATDLAVQHAVWDLLYRLDYRQFFPGETWEVIPDSPDLAIAVDTKERPDFHARRIWYNWGMWGYNNEPYAQWSARNRVVQGFQLNSGHSYGEIIDANRAAFDEHPEYFALIDGKREYRGGDTKLCIGNENLRQLVVDYMVSKVKANPGLDSVSTDPSDGGGWCEDCELCAQLGSGSVSDIALTLANDVAAAINDAGVGEKYVGMYAYNQHSPPPTIEVHPNVIISATTAFIRGGYTFDQIIEGWQAQGATLGVYDYFTVIAWDWNLPRRAKTARPISLAQSLRKFHEQGARFFDAESGDAWGPYGLGFYVAGRVIWDVDEADRAEEIVEDFLTKAFGPAKEPMAKFYHLIGEDGTRRSNADLLGRMYRHLAQARELAADAPDVRQRIDDLILYTRYAELYFNFASVTGDAQAAAREDMLRHAYRMRETMMIHAYGLFARTVGQGAAHDPDYPLKSEEPFTEEELSAMLENGIAANEPVEMSFETVEYSEELVPAAQALDLREGEPGQYPTVPQERHIYYVWVDEAPAKIQMQVTVQKVWATQAHRISLYSPQAVDVEAVDESEIVRPDGETYDVVLETPYEGLHRVEVQDGADYTRIVWPEDLKVTVPSPLEGRAVTTHFRGEWTMYFYVPKGTKTVAGWAARIANWAPRISGTLQDAQGNVHLDFAEIEDGWFHVEVPEGQDGKVWKFANSQGVRQLVTVPPYMSVSPQGLLLPKEVVAADGN